MRRYLGTESCRTGRTELLRVLARANGAPRGREYCVFRRQSASPVEGKPIKIDAKVVSHALYVVLQIAEVAIQRDLFADILRIIAELPPPLASTA